MIAPLLERLLRAEPLAAAEMRRLFDAWVDPNASDTERSALLVAVSARPVDPGELALAALELRRRARPFPVALSDRPVDLCGSGGAPRPSFNVSTVSAFVVAAAGQPVVKHGNRSYRSLCGSSDLLEALGLPVTSSLAFPRALYRAELLAFLHAPLFHPAMASVREARRIVGVPTIFNRLGPLSNPARVPFQVVGTRDRTLARLYAKVLPALGVRRGVAMSSSDGRDEFSPRRPTHVVGWGRGVRPGRALDPERFLESAERAGSWGPLAPEAAAQETRRLLAGGQGARRGSVLLTAGVALWATGGVETIRAGVERARRAIDSGGAKALLERTVALGSEFRRRAA